MIKLNPVERMLESLYHEDVVLDTNNLDDTDNLDILEPVTPVSDPLDITGAPDYEGSMAKNQLESLVRNAQMLNAMLLEQDALPAWCQSKITIAEESIETVYNYLRSEVEDN